MRTWCMIFGLCLFQLLCAGAVLAQWVQTNGPFGGKVLDVIGSDTNLFVTNYVNIFRSTDEGDNWVQVATDLPGFYNIGSLATIGTNLFAGTLDGGVFLTTDNGTNWKAVNSGLTVTDVQVLAVSGPPGEENLFAGTLDKGVYLSTSNGAQWAAANSGIENSRVYNFAVSGTNIFAITTDGIFRSTNNGTLWTVADSGLPSNFLDYAYHICFSESGIFCGVSGAGIYFSADTGAHWTLVNSEELIRHSSALFINGTDLLTGIQGGIMRSTDYGMSWARLNVDPPNPSINVFRHNGSNFFAATEGGGVYRSTNGGSDWTQINKGISLSINCVAAHGVNLFAGTGTGGVYHSTDNGNSWTEILFAAVAAIALTDTTLFYGGGHEGVLLSTDFGTSWTQVHSGLTNLYVHSIAISGSYVFAGTEEGIFRSGNNGTAWTKADSDLATDTIWALAANSSAIFAGTRDGLFRSSDNGSSWTMMEIMVNSGWKFESVYTLVGKGDTLFAGTNQGYYLSVDNGTSWTFMPSSTLLDILALASTDNYLFAGTSRSVWRIPLSEISGVKYSTRIPSQQYSLAQNYPNPFNPTTVIDYTLPVWSHVTLKLYNMLGQVVSTLVDGQQEMGYQSATWNASNAPSGVYYYRIAVRPTSGGETETFQAVKKMLLVK